MIKKLLFTLSLCMLVGSTLFAQSTIKGEIKGPDGSPVPFLQVLLKNDGRTVNGAYTDDMGNYQIFGIPAGTYDITAGGTLTCLTLQTTGGIYVSASEVKFVNIVINCSSNELDEVVVQYVPPVFSQDNTTSSSKLTGDEVRKTPGRSITSALANLEGVASVDGDMASVRGNRPDGQQTIIDGVRVRGNGGVTMQSVEGAELIQGGIPAEYGDGTSFTVITTRGVAKDYHGGIELRGSLEGYNQFLLAASVSGPILKGKTPQDPARMGFLISAEGNFDQDGRPARGGTWAAKQSAIDKLAQNPINYTYDPVLLNLSFIPAAEYITSENFYKRRVRANAYSYGFLAQAKIDIMGGGKDARGKPRNNLRFSIGGSYQYGSGRGWGYGSSLFNSNNNSVSQSSTLRLNARLNHRVKTDTAANAVLKNIMYDINVNYTLVNGKSYDPTHKDNYFDYGYIGKFSTIRRQNYGSRDSVQVWSNIREDTMWVYNIRYNELSSDSITIFDGTNTRNPNLRYYTQNFVNEINRITGNDWSRESMWSHFGIGTLPNIDFFSGYGGLINGTGPDAIAKGLYSAPGVISTGNSKSRTEAIGAKLSLSMNLKNHEVKFGFDFEKLTQRSYSVSPYGLWNLMRQMQNFHIRTLDFQNPYWKYGTGTATGPDPDSPDWYDEIVYNTYVNTEEQFSFDRNLRIKLGMDPNGSDWLDVDSYDPSTYDLSMFSNLELLNNGNSYVGYYGWDYTGTKFNKKKTNITDFFDKADYSIGAFEPVYMALYLQDKFSISNLLFNVGLRLDYFNANQSVLKDPFLFRESYTVSGLRSLNDQWLFVDNAKDNWVVYVSEADKDAANAPKSIVAYRDGKIWYNSYGQEIADPATVLGTGGPVLLKAPDADAISKVSGGAFTKYKPQWSVMPRISFSFPVSTNSLFYAHYNIITYRPTNLQLDPVAYLFIATPAYSSSIISNPNLKSQKSIDYEIGFRQKVGENAAINFAAYYSEKRDQIQSYLFSGAYPIKYYSYENQDFGTVQGFVLGMTMRGAKNLTFRASYTISFAKGTGSSSQSQLALLQSGQPNLRTLANLSFDQRHKISGNIDFRFDQGTNYNGPVTVKQKKGTDKKKEIRWLENSGITLLFSAASGMPYSRSATVYSAIWANEGQRQTKGSINGASMPWIFQADLRIDKSFALNLASKKEKTDGGKQKKKPGMLTVYLDFQNLLNLKNVISVYDFTGSASDDGYLSSALFQTNVAAGSYYSVPAITNYYEMRINNPFNYNQPFRVYLGLQFSF